LHSETSLSIKAVSAMEFHAKEGRPEISGGR
jgi:hypothetical protein